ncbi:MAG TPA: 6,7-dimethyl-8-ribityllumazine synthase [Wenzhouxiangella sp.]
MSASQFSPAVPERIAIVVAKFNAQVTEWLRQGAHQALLELGMEADQIDTLHVPGAWELPLACHQLAMAGRHQGIIALGAVIRGETAHFDFISQECARGLGQVALETGVPVGFGVLTTENAEQAFERADPSRKDKGREVAEAVVEMVTLSQTQPVWSGPDEF